MMMLEYINFVLLIFISIKLDILTEFGVNLFSVLSMVALLIHTFSKEEKKD